MSLNHVFIIEEVKRLAGARAVMLDFGCGEGELVRLARAAGLRASGCDRYDGPWAEQYDKAVSDPQLAFRIARIDEDGRLPCPAATFDAVVSNMVLEHVADLRGPFAEIARVLKPGGLFLALFPTREVWSEAHVGVPFAHRFAAGSRGQRSYLWLAHWFGLGSRRGQFSRQIWVDAHVDALRAECFHKPAREIEDQLARDFELVAHGEADWVRFRVANNWRLRRLGRRIAPARLDRALRFFGTRLATSVFVLRRRANSEELPVH